SADSPALASALIALDSGLRDSRSRSRSTARSERARQVLQASLYPLVVSLKVDQYPAVRCVMPHSTLKPVATLDLRPDGVRGVPGKIRRLFDRDVAHGGELSFSPYARELSP